MARETRQPRQHVGMRILTGHVEQHGVERLTVQQVRGRPQCALDVAGAHYRQAPQVHSHCGSRGRIELPRQIDIGGHAAAVDGGGQGAQRQSQLAAGRPAG